MRKFTVCGSEYAALIVLSDDVDYDSMEVVEWNNGKRGKIMLEFRMDDHSARLSFVGEEVDISLVRASLDVFREEFFEPRLAAGVPCPPW